MAMPTIVASNQTGGALLLTRLGLTVPASSTLTLTDFASVNEVRDDSSLEGFIDAGSILLTYGNGDLTKGDSLKFFSIVTSEVKIPVRGMSTTNIASLSGTTTVDTSVSLIVNDRVLLTGQSTASENGVWVVKAGAWVRPEDFAIDQSASSVFVQIQEGTVHADETWHCTNNEGAGIIDTDLLTFVEQGGGGGGGVANLQEAYEGGNTIAVTSGEGDLAVTLTSADFTVDGANGVLFGGSTPLATFNVDTGLMSLDSTDTTNLTMTANNAADRVLTIASTNAGAGNGLLAMSSDGATDIDAGLALSLNSSGGVINIGNDAVAQAINVGTGTAARVISIGNATGATQLDLDSGTAGTLIDSTGIISLDGVGGSNFTTDTGNLLLATTTSGAVNVSSAGAVDVQAVGNVTIDSSGGTIGIGTDADTGALSIGTGGAARTISIGNATGATALAFTSGTGGTLFTTPVFTITGNLVVQGTTTTVESEIVNVADSFMYLNDGYTTVAALTGGIVWNILPTSTTDTVAVGGFSASGGGENGEVATTAAAAFAVGDFIQVSGAADQTNDGLYEVLTSVANVLTIAGIGGEGAATFNFTQNDFTDDATVAGTITKVTVGVFRVSTTGVPQFGFDSDNTLVFNNIIVDGTSTTLSLQTAYDGGQTITTDGSGNVIIAGTQALQVSATNGLDVDTLFDFDGTFFDVLMTGDNGFSLDGTASSNVSTTNSVAATASVLTLEATNTGTGASNSTVVISATSTNGSGTIDMDADDAVAIDVGADGTIDIGTAAAASVTTIGNNTGASGVNIDSGTEQVEIDGVTYYGANAGLPSATGSGFQDGDKFYDTDLDMEMRFDAGRTKWLSVEAMYFQFGRQGNVAATVYYRGIDGQVMSSTLGYHMPENGTIVALGYTRADSDAATFDVVEGGTSRATLASSATSGRSTALDGDFSQGGILAVQNQAAGGTTSDVMGWVKVKFRSV